MGLRKTQEIQDCRSVKAEDDADEDEDEEDEEEQQQQQQQELPLALESKCFKANTSKEKLIKRPEILVSETE